MRAFEKRQYGFTLVEMIIVIVITGIIAGIVAIFIRAPVQGYVDSARRAELTDIADTAVRRLSRDVRIAVPNSVRVANCGVVPCVEFLPTKDGGRYRALPVGNMLFATNNGIFDVIGPVPSLVAGDFIVVGSTQSDGSLAYLQTNAGVLRSYTSVAGTTVTMNATALPVTSELPSQRFDVVDGVQQAVTYACVGTLGALDASLNGQARLVRYWKYGFNPAQVNPPVGAGMLTAVLADKVSNCVIDYGLPNQRFGLVAVRLTLTSGGESVSLYNEIHVNNSP